MRSFSRLDSLEYKEHKNLLVNIEEEIEYEKLLIGRNQQAYKYFQRKNWKLTEKQDSLEVELSKKTGDISLSLIFRAKSIRPWLGHVDETIKKYQGNKEEKDFIVAGYMNDGADTITDDPDFKLEMGLYLYKPKKDYLFAKVVLADDKLYFDSFSSVTQEFLAKHKREFYENAMTKEFTVEADLSGVKDEFEAFLKLLGLDSEFLTYTRALSINKDQMLYIHFLDKFQRLFQVD